MKHIYFLLLVLGITKINAQEVETFYNDRSSGYGTRILNTCVVASKEYLLINNVADSIFDGSRKFIFKNDYNISLLLKENESYSVSLGYNTYGKSHSKLFELNNQLYLGISSSDSFNLNGKNYYSEGAYMNFFLFRVGDELILQSHLYNEKFDINPHIYNFNKQTQFLFFIKSNTINSKLGNEIETKLNKKSYDGYSLLCKFENNNFEVEDDLAFNFYDENEINYQSPFVYYNCYGSGALMRVLSLGMEVFRNDELLAKTDAFDGRRSIYYPVSNFLDKAVKPLVLSHDLGYIVFAKSFYEKNGKWNFFLNSTTASKICFKDQCLSNPNSEAALNIRLNNYDWETGEGNLERYPENHNYAVNSVVKYNEKVYILAEFVQSPGYWSSPDFNFSKQS